MARRFPTDRDEPVCPFIERRDARCAGRFRLAGLAEAMRLCLGDFDRCEAYRQIRGEAGFAADAPDDPAAPAADDPTRPRERPSARSHPTEPTIRGSSRLPRPKPPAAREA